jgi:3-oxoacyl-[acyl-carrier protein] reductase
VLSIVKSLAREFAGSGVRINALTPGPTDTPMHAGVSAELKQRIGAGLPIGRMGHPDDLAAAAVYLCSPAARFVYASSLNVDGGSLYE